MLGYYAEIIRVEAEEKLVEMYLCDRTALTGNQVAWQYHVTWFQNCENEFNGNHAINDINRTAAFKK